MEDERINDLSREELIKLVNAYMTEAEKEHGHVVVARREIRELNEKIYKLQRDVYELSKLNKKMAFNIKKAADCVTPKLYISVYQEVEKELKKLEAIVGKEA